jgi:hypothetical protein
MQINHKNIFLLDGIGATLSAVLTGLILPMFSDFLGIPTLIFYCLAIFPVIYCLYSYSCYFFVKRIKPQMLIAIIWANLCYCLISSAVMLFLKDITIWGRLLLFSEVLVVIAVIALEIKVYRTGSKRI